MTPAHGTGPASAHPRISLAQWSLHRTIERGALRGLEFPAVARERFGIGTVELVNTLLEDSSGCALDGLRRLADGHGVSISLVMVDDEGDLAAPGEDARRRAVDAHARWLERAARLGARAVRVNTGGGAETEGDRPPEDPAVAAALDRCLGSLVELCERAAPLGLEVLLENHGGLSSNTGALVELVRRAGRPELGTLPDFGNFPPGTDVEAAVDRLMPWAGAVSAKCFDFDEAGNESTLDYRRLLEVVHRRRPGAPRPLYRGPLGIEYEGDRLSEEEGVRACQRLLERLLPRWDA